jgi:hypothetical protein
MVIYFRLNLLICALYCGADLGMREIKKYPRKIPASLTVGLTDSTFGKYMFYSDFLLYEDRRLDPQTKLSRQVTIPLGYMELSTHSR